jgi:hypothetical protein
VASDSGDNDSDSDTRHEPRECMACRGSGQVISSLGGTATKVTCPWCNGGAVRLTDIDAQSGWPEPAPPRQPDGSASPAPGAAP